MSLVIVAASELKTYDFVECSEMHIANFLFLYRDPIQEWTLAHTKVLHKPLMKGSFRAVGRPFHPPTRLG